jgi:hypothetical protein
MNETDQPRPSRGRGLIAGLFGMFVLGVLAMGFLVSRTDLGRDMVSAETPPVPKPQALVQTPQAAPVPQPATAVSGDLAYRLATLEGRVASLEARPMGGASVSAPKAEALFLVLASARKFERGQPLGTLERELTARFGLSQAGAVAALSGWTKQPVSAGQVRRDFDMLVPASASEQGSWWDRLTNGIGSLITVRDQSTPSTAPAHLITQARALLDADDVAGALALARQLPASDGVKGWISEADRFLKARQALDKLEEQALSGEMGTVQPAPSPAPVAAPPLAQTQAPSPEPASSFD